MKELPLIILAVVFVGLILYSRRSREKAARTDASRRDRLHPGVEVMTTSGLYGTVVSVDPERDTALVSIAPGVEVTWAIAALREAGELPVKYRSAAGQPPATPNQPLAAPEAPYQPPAGQPNQPPAGHPEPPADGSR